MADLGNPYATFQTQLRENSFFASMADEDFSILTAQARPAEFAVGAMVFAEGEPSLGLCWLQTGTLKAVKYSTTGKEQILHFIGPGQTFNEVGAFTTLPNPVSVLVLEAASVWRLPAVAIRRQIEQDSDFAQAVINVLSSRLRDSTTLIEDLSLRPVISRLAHMILQEAEGDTLFRPSWYTQQELAARVGSVSDVVQRSLRRLEDDQAIAVSRQQIRIVDRRALEQHAE